MSKLQGPSGRETGAHTYGAVIFSEQAVTKGFRREGVNSI
jgi:hypothetical protein